MFGDDCPGRLGEMHNVGLAIFATMGRNAPGSGFGIDLTWACLNNLLPALTSERQELDDSAVRPWHLTRRGNDCGEFIIGQHTISADLPVVRGEAFCRRGLNHGSTHAPA